MGKRHSQTEFACLVGHEALHQGKLSTPTYGYWYEGSDDRGLPTYFCGEDDCSPDESPIIVLYKFEDNYWRGTQPLQSSPLTQQLTDEQVAEISQEHENWLGELEGLAIAAIYSGSWEPLLQHIEELRERQESGETNDSLKHREAMANIEAAFDLAFGRDFDHAQ